MGTLRMMARDTSVYEVWTMDKTNFTPLGMVLLWVPYLLLHIIATFWIAVLFACVLAFALPMAGLGWCLGQLDERYHLNAHLNTGLCKLSTGLKLLRRC